MNQGFSLLETNPTVVPTFLPGIKVRKLEVRPIIFIGAIDHHANNIINHLELVFFPAPLMKGIALRFFWVIFAEIGI